MGRLSRMGLAIVAVVASSVLVAVRPASAGVIVGVTTSLPNSVQVGDRGLSGTLALTNQSTPPQGPGPVTVTAVTLVPSCAVLVLENCPAASVDPGVLQLSATAFGEPGTACAGVTFSISTVDAAQGKALLSPGQPVVLGSPGSPTDTCRIDFSFNVAKVPTKDASTSREGIQTAYLGSASATAGGQQAVGSGSSLTTVQPAPVVPPPTGSGYWLVASDGGIFAFGRAVFHGSTGAMRLSQPIVGMAAAPSGNGYFLVAADGGIFAFGDAVFRGSTGASRLNRPIVGMAVTPSGNGYFLVASDGGIFAFGDAVFRGSTGALALTQPIRGMATTPSGNGYFLVASDGGIFAFGDAIFQGSTGGRRLTQPIRGMAVTPSGNGYFLVASDGGIFAFGDAVFRGSTGGVALTRPVVGMAATPSGDGYWLVAADGGIFAFPDALFQGSTGGLRLNRTIEGMAARP